MHRCLVGLLLAALIPTTASAAKPDRAAALAGYQRDLVSILVLRDDATHLLGAALLARPLTSLPKGLDSAYLLDRAAHAPGAGPAITWMQLSACNPDGTGCPNPTALAALQKQAPRNAAVWAVVLDQALQQHATDAANDALLQAAASDHYDDYAGATLEALAKAATALPVPPAALTAYAGKTAAGPASAQAFLALGAAGLHPRPALAPIVAWCTESGHAGVARHAPCLQLAHVLVWGSSPEARAAGLHLQEVLAPDKDARAKAASGLRDLAWQVQNYSRLSLDALTDETLAVEWLRLAQRGGSEASVMNALLHRHDIPLEAPDEPTPAADENDAPANAASATAPAPAATAGVAPPPATAPASPATAATAAPASTASAGGASTP